MKTKTKTRVYSTVRDLPTALVEWSLLARLNRGKKGSLFPLKLERGRLALKGSQPNVAFTVSSKTERHKGET